MKSTLLFIAAALGATVPAGASDIHRQYIHDGWTVASARHAIEHPASVPGTVHTDLMAAGVIQDPFIGLNERGVQWVDKEDWIYTTTFTPTSDIAAADSVVLAFDGLDTYADVFVNDSLVLKADNMFRRWRVPVKSLLKDGENTLRVYFHSPIKVDMPKWEALPFAYEAGNDQSENGGVFDRKVSVFARKAGYHYGWDWGPRLVTSGIWRPVSLEAWSGTRFSDIFVDTKKIAKNKASMEALVSLDVPESFCGTLDIYDGSRRLARRKVSFEPGDTTVAVPFTVTNPRLWWCNGLGNPDLYDFRFVLSDSHNRTVATDTVTTGIRTIEVVREEEPDGGRSFYFRLNGVPVFAKGANYIPSDSFLPRVTEENYSRTIGDAVAANMNMLRIWGGGVYEDDVFYDLCDRNGIMLWQDFMFACSLYPAEGELLENIRLEAVDNVHRLRNHPSIALWCGNNEMLDGWYGWGWQRRYRHQGVEDKVWAQYDTLFHHVLPEVVEENHPSVLYWPSSPFSRVEGRAEPHRGDYHYWEVWAARKPFENYNTTRARFFSEYGFQSFPEPETVGIYVPDSADRSIGSEVMMSHQRGGADANAKILHYIRQYYPEPRDFDHLLYLSQVQQGDAIRTAIEAHRRDKPYCMGSLFWQINDCWPVASWSSRDYYGRWKAQHYFTRTAFDDILVSPVVKPDTVAVTIVSDRRTPVGGTLTIHGITLGGDTVFTKGFRTLIPADGTYTAVIQANEVLAGQNPAGMVLEAKFTPDGKDGRTYSAVRPMLRDKDMAYSPAALNVSTRRGADGKSVDVSVSSPTFVRALFLSVPGHDTHFSDNFFDILPGGTVTVNVPTDLSPEKLKSSLRTMSMAEK